MIYEYGKVSDTDEFVLDLKGISNVKSENHNVQSFNTRVPDAEIPDNLYNRQLQQSEHLKPLLSLCI